MGGHLKLVVGKYGQVDTGPMSCTSSDDGRVHHAVVTFTAVRTEITGRDGRRTRPCRSKTLQGNDTSS